MELAEDALANWDMSSAVRMNYMFDDSRNIVKLNLSGWNMPNLITATHMFSDCTNLQSVDLSDWNTPKLISMDCMFGDCHSLTYLNLSSIDTATVQEYGQLFERCKSLVKIDGLEYWDTSSAREFEEMFRECYALKELNLSTFNTTGVVNEHWMEWQPEDKENIGYGCLNMFLSTNGLDKLVLGANFSFDGDGKVTTESYKVKLPAPNNAEGLWYDEEGKSYTPDTIPQKTAGTYYAVNPVQP
jgi:surface protein